MENGVINPTKPGEGILDQTIKNGDVEDTIIIGQGQEAVLIGKDSEHLYTGHSNSSARGYQRQLLQQGNKVDQTIHNVKLTRATIIGQGQNVQVVGFDFGTINKARAQENQPEAIANLQHRGLPKKSSA